VSTLVTTYLHRDSIYTMKLTRRGIDLYEEEHHNLLKGLFVHDIIDREPECIEASASLPEVVTRVLGSDHHDFFVVGPGNRLEGTIHLRDFTRMLVEQEILTPIVVARDLAEPDTFTVNENDDLDVVMQLFTDGLREEIPVVSAEDPRRITGSVHKKDVIHAYNREVLRRDLAGSMSNTVLVAHKGQQVELGGGYVLQEIAPPSRFFGHSIRGLDIQAQTGVHIVLLRKREATDGKPAVRVPTADDVIDEGDRLVVSGTRSAVEALDAV